MALDTFKPYLFVSAGEQSNKFLTPNYADGIARFQAQRAQQLTKLLVQIVPVQEGTGDPAPDNIRPISGRTGMTVTRAGKNLLNPALTYGLLSITIGASETDITQSTRYGYTDRFPSESDVILSIRSNDRALCEYAKIVQYVDGVVVAVATNVNMADTTTWYTKVMPGRPNSYCRLIIGGLATDCGTYIHGDAQIEVGSTATEYEPYNATEIPITWETEAGTVYGGTLNVTTGVLTVDRGFAELSEDWWWSKSSSYLGAYFVTRDVVPGTAKVRTPFVCSHAKTVTRIADYVFGTCYCDNSLNFRIMGASSTLQDWKDYIAAQRTAGTPVQICYYLATPVTYQLDPEEVQTLAGYNQIYSDAGPVIDIQF